MDMSGEVRIAAPREAVWRALNDPEILRQCIPGCEEIEKLSDTEMTAKVTAKVGPVKARFGGKVTLSNLDPPNGYKISGEGQGGAAGFAKGGAAVRLTPDGSGTMLHYEVNAAVGGKLAQIGSRLIDGTARKMADDFFTTFANLVAASATPATAPTPGEAGVTAAPAPAAATPIATPHPPAAPRRAGLAPWVWVAGLIVIVLILLAIFGLR
jgi:carbon monoxide dehydrogenase subunit G